MNVVGYGGGTNSTAMLIGLWQRRIPVDLILFADPGGEQPHTYAYLEIMDRWLAEHWDAAHHPGMVHHPGRPAAHPGAGMPPLRFPPLHCLWLQKVFPQAQGVPPGEVLPARPPLPEGVGRRRPGGQVHRL